MPGHTIKSEGGKRYLIFDYFKRPYGPSIADYPEAMADTIDALMTIDADLVVLAEAYERVYSEEQTKMLRGIADMLNKLEVEGVWSPSHLSGGPACDKFLPERHDAVVNIVNLIRADPFRAYMSVIEEWKKEKQKTTGMPPDIAECSQVYLETLSGIREGLEGTDLIRRMKTYLAKIGQLPTDRSIYHVFFEAQIKPSFIGSRLVAGETGKFELVDQYEVLGTTINIYRHPDRLEMLYYLYPPEYNLSPEKFYLLTKTKEIVAAHRPKGLGFANVAQARRYFKRIYGTTIADLARTEKIRITPEEMEDLAEIVTRYTIGYGVVEIVLSDRQLTDIYFDAPLGEKPIYMVHSKYGQVQSNLIFTPDEAKGLVSRFRALSGRPFDEAHPVLDYDLEQLQARVAVIGPPLSSDGVAMAFRLHKMTPWTLPQFVDIKMMNSYAAGLLSYLMDAQSSTMVTGSRGSGKTSLTQALMLEIPQNLRIIVQEDTQEIPVPYMKRIGFSIQRLKTRSAIGTAEGTVEVAPEDALRTALRLGDSVLVVGEVRSREAKVLYEAMRVGAVGNVVMGTIHGESAYSVWDRVVNDLEVPSTSFKATDVVLVAAPIRFKGALQRNRRLIQVTEVGKHWKEDPEEEKGFLDLMTFDAIKDRLGINTKAIEGGSEMMQKIQRMRGIAMDDIWDEIQFRADEKQYLVDVKNKLGLPDLLEAENAVPAHNKLLLIAERQRAEVGAVEHKEALDTWKTWLNEFAKDLLKEKQMKK